MLRPRRPYTLREREAWRGWQHAFSAVTTFKYESQVTQHVALTARQYRSEEEQHPPAGKLVGKLGLPNPLLQGVQPAGEDRGLPCMGSETVGKWPRMGSETECKHGAPAQSMQSDARRALAPVMPGAKRHAGPMQPGSRGPKPEALTNPRWGTGAGPIAQAARQPGWPDWPGPALLSA